MKMPDCPEPSMSTHSHFRAQSLPNVKNASIAEVSARLDIANVSINCSLNKIK